MRFGAPRAADTPKSASTKRNRRMAAPTIEGVRRGRVMSLAAFQELAPETRADSSREAGIWAITGRATR